MIMADVLLILFCIALTFLKRMKNGKSAGKIYGNIFKS